MLYLNKVSAEKFAMLLTSMAFPVNDYTISYLKIET